MRPLFGIVLLLAIAFACSEDRRRIPWRTVISGIVLQWGLALLLLRLPLARALVLRLNGVTTALQDATDAGTRFVFGYLAGGPTPFQVVHPEAGFVLALQAMPLVLSISALASLLFYWGILQRITALFAALLRRTMGIGGPLALGAAVHVFVGMIEAPLLIRPWLTRLQRGELFALMAVGMAGVAGTVMVIYAGFLADLVPGALGHILIASVISTPAGLAMAALMVPFDPDPAPGGTLVLPDPPHGAIDALVKGTMEGIPVLAGILALLLVAVALVHLIDALMALIGPVAGAPISLVRIFALPFRPLLWLLGLSWRESAAAAQLMATKTVLNEFVAYLHLAALPAASFDPRGRLIMLYALCGFANFGSLGIMIGGMGAMVPERRGEIVGLGLRAILAGTLATLSSGAVAGLLG
ncbi:MAG: nucleoside:proton symporter [Rhodospirillales bacterium]|nr:nucleoside:proton symporter [Rhodospirillales bacterium]